MNNATKAAFVIVTASLLQTGSRKSEALTIPTPGPVSGYIDTYDVNPKTGNCLRTADVIQAGVSPVTEIECTPTILKYVPPEHRRFAKIASEPGGVQ